MIRRPGISVCIATFNGEKYIQRQLHSILSQLSDKDEIVISDDSSTDNTLAIIRNFEDLRIKIHEDQHFKSPIYNFGFCISQAQGNIIYLADQDDFWLPTKVEIINAAFRKDSALMLVATNGYVVEESSEAIPSMLYGNKTKFTSSVFKNIIKNRFVGCTLAFRREIVDIILPLPSHLPMHDSWIGIMSKIFGKVHFIDEPLITYRRHTSNFSRTTRSGVAQVIRWRVGLTANIILRYAKHCHRKRRCHIKSLNPGGAS